MKEEFVTYEIDLALRDLGFDEDCFGFYSLMDNNKPVGGNYPCNGTNSAPTYQQAFKYFREEYQIYCGFVAHNTIKINWGTSNLFQFIEGDTDEDTQQKCLVEIIKELKDVSKKKPK